MVRVKYIGYGTLILSVPALIVWFFFSSHFNVEMQKDQICAGTYGDICEWEYNVTLTGLRTYYIYNRNQIEIEFVPDVKQSWHCKRDGRFTSAKRANREEFPCGIGWREFDWKTPLTDKYKYIEKFTKNKKKEYKLVVLKFNPTDEIKFGGKITGEEFDPKFLPLKFTSPFRFNFDNEETNISSFARIAGEKITIPFESSINKSKGFGFVFSRGSIVSELAKTGKTFDDKLYYQIDSNQIYEKNKLNPLVLERNLPGQTLVTNEIGQVIRRTNKRFLTFEEIFGKEVNLFDFNVREVNATDPVTNITQTVNITFKDARDISIDFQNTSTIITDRIFDDVSGTTILRNRTVVRWLIEFFNLFDLDPSFIDDTDSNWDAGTNSNFQTLGTGQGANISSTSTSGHFASQVFDAGSIANWTNITIVTEANYEIEIGRAKDDKTIVSDEDTSTFGYINTSGLVALYHFNNNSAFGENASGGGSADVIYDFSVEVNSERSGSLANNATFTTTGSTINKTVFKFGSGAAELGGVDQVILAPDIDDMENGDMSMTAWMRLDTLSADDATIVSKFGGGVGDRPWYWRIATDGTIVFVINNANSNTATGGIVTDRWYFYSIVYNTGTSDVEMYLDGVELSKTASNFADIDNSDIQISIGLRGISGGNDDTDGQIDEVALWNRTLSSDEILNLYKRGTFRLNVSARTCDDSACVGETYTNIQSNNISSGFKIPLNLTGTGRYFQYNITYANETGIDVTAIVNNVSIQFATTEDTDFTNIIDATGRKTSEGFGEGFLNQTFFNSTINSISLNPAFGNGTFESHVIDGGGVVNWTNVSWIESVPYQREIGRAGGRDKNDPEKVAGDGSGGINTSGLVFLMHFNNESIYGEATEDGGGLDETVRDFSVDVNSERSGEDALNGTFNDDATIDKADFVLGGGAASFDGTLDFIESDDPNNRLNLAITGHVLTLSMWLKRGSIDVVQNTFSKSTGSVGWRAFMDNSNTVGFVTSAVKAYDFTATITDTTEWHHLVYVYDSSFDVTLYFDGDSGETVTHTVAGKATSSNIVIAARQPASTTQLFTGLIDEVAVWNRTLSSAEARNLYLRGAAKLNLSVRTCDDNQCDGETYTEFTNSSKSDLFLTKNQFIQYKANYYTSDIGRTVEMYNVTFHHAKLFDFTRLINQSGQVTLEDYINGTLNQTFFNTTIDAIQLDTDFGNGTYVSKVFDLLASSPLQNISWTEAVPYQKEIGRAGGRDGNTISVEDISTFGGINTSGLLLLMYFNNDTGENDSLVKDYSPEVNSEKSGNTENNATCGLAAGTCPTYDFTNRKTGRASMSFDDTNDALSLGDVLDFTVARMTITAWINPKSPSAEFSRILDKDNNADTGYLLGFDRTNNRLFFSIGGTNSFSDTNSITKNVWQHVAVAYDGSNANHYVNGVTAGSPAFTEVPVDTTHEFGIGNLAGGGREYFGHIDELSIWNRTLSSDEVKNLYLRGAARLNLSVRSCNDALCDGEGFDLNVGNSTKSDISSLSDNQFIQYRAEFSVDESNNTLPRPTIQIFNTTIHYGVADVSDTTKPIINGTLNQTLTSIIQNSVINATFNITDETGLDNATIIINNTGFNRLFNFSLTGTTIQISQNFTISEAAGTVINITGRVNDTSGNLAQNETIFTVAVTPAADTCSPTSPLIATHNFEAADNCIISTAINAAGNDVTCSGSDGTLTIADSGSIVNVGKFVVHDVCEYACYNPPCVT